MLSIIEQLLLKLLCLHIHLDEKSREAAKVNLDIIGALQVKFNNISRAKVEECIGS